MQTDTGLSSYPMIDDEEIKSYRDWAVAQVMRNLALFTDAFPDSNSTNQYYQPTENVEWTTGFFTGQIWLAYEAVKLKVTKHDGEPETKVKNETNELLEQLQKAGEIHVESFLQRIEQQIDVSHHDMGFLYSPSCVAAYQLTGNPKARKAAILAANQLMSRFHEKGQFFQAWGTLGAKDNYRLIIDCLLNMPLLFWASRETSDDVYRQKAEAHIVTAMECVLRPDNSTYHTYFFDPETGLPLRGVTHQGNRDGSAWSRGQAWGIYGSAISYRLLGKPEYIEIFKKTTDYFLKHLPADLVPYWDFDFDDGSQEPRDSSAVAIAVCGLLEMAELLPADEGKYYREIARRLLKALVEQCAVKDIGMSNGLLLHGTYARDSADNPCQNRGVDECNTWGDYFYLEALTRLSGPWNSYW